MVSWFQSFLVFLVLEFSVSWFLDFLVSKFLSFKDAKSFNVFKRYWFHITKCPFHVFLVGNDLISKIFTILLDGVAGIFGACLFDI